MNRCIIAVVDSTKARFLKLESLERPGSAPGAILVEQPGLTSPTQDLGGQELWSSTKTGRNRGMGGQAHSYDDHRDSHKLEFERRFAQAIATRTIEELQTLPAQNLILIAEPQVLGLMREVLTPLLPKYVKVSELAKNLCALKPNELQEYLASKGLVPARRSVSAER